MSDEPSGPRSPEPGEEPTPTTPRVRRVGSRRDRQSSATALAPSSPRGLEPIERRSAPIMTIIEPGVAVSRPRPRDWAPKFLRVLGQTFTVGVAARAAGVSRQAAYKRRDHDLGFAEAWDEVVESCVDEVEGGVMSAARAGNLKAALVILRAHRPKYREQRAEPAFDYRAEAARIGAESGRSADEVLAAAEALSRGGSQR